MQCSICLPRAQGHLKLNKILQQHCDGQRSALFVLHKKVTLISIEYFEFKMISLFCFYVSQDQESH